MKLCVWEGASYAYYKFQHIGICQVGHSYIAIVITKTGRKEL